MKPRTLVLLLFGGVYALGLILAVATGQTWSKALLWPVYRFLPSPVP
jgi:hypothetical protein